MKKATALLLALGMSLAYAGSSYHLTLYKATTVNGTQLKPGDCKLELQGEKIVFKQGKASAESSVTVQNGGHKFEASSVTYDADAPEQIQEIRLGGTSTKLVFASGVKTASADGGR